MGFAAFTTCLIGLHPGITEDPLYDDVTKGKKDILLTEYELTF